MNVSVHVGEGEEVLASVRNQKPVLGFVSNELHKRMVRQHVLSVVLQEYMEDIEDGFVFRRRLRKQRSALGDDAASAARAREELPPAARLADAPPVTVPKVPVAESTAGTCKPLD